MNTYVSPLTSQARRKSPGWAAFDLKQRQGNVPQADVVKDPYPPMSTTVTKTLPADNVVSARSFSSGVLPSTDIRNKLTLRVGVPKGTKVTNESSHDVAFKKLKDVHKWADNSLIEDVMATVDNDIEKAATLLKEMASVGETMKDEGTRQSSSSNDLRSRRMLDKDLSVGKITDLAAEIANLSSTLEDSLNVNHKELQDMQNSYDHMLSDDAAANMKLVLGHLRSIPVEPEWEEDDVYLCHRKDALRMMRLASQHSRAATNAFLRGDHFTAKQLSLKAQEEWLAAEKLNNEAAKHILTIRNDKNDPWKLDLHGLHASEAVQALQEHLQKVENQVPMNCFVSPIRIRTKYETIRSEPLDSSVSINREKLNIQPVALRQRPTLIQVITGVGNHSRGQAALPTAVRNFLIDNGYRFDEARPGVITVRPKFRHR